MLRNGPEDSVFGHVAIDMDSQAARLLDRLGEASHGQEGSAWAMDIVREFLHSHDTLYGKDKGKSSDVVRFKLS